VTRRVANAAAGGFPASRPPWGALLRRAAATATASGSSGGNFDSPATVPPPPTGTALPNEGHSAQRRCRPEVFHRWRVRHPASAGHL